MYRVIAALFLLLASVASSSAQNLSPSVWQGQRGSLLKVLAADAASGNFTGVFIGSPGGPCPGVPYELAGQIRGPRVVFQTSRSWIARSDCPVTTVWSGRFVSPTTVATRWIANTRVQMAVRSGYEAKRSSSASERDFHSRLCAILGQPSAGSASLAADG
jgi:hypothetical protein